MFTRLATALDYLFSRLFKTASIQLIVGKLNLQMAIFKPL